MKKRGDARISNMNFSEFVEKKTAGDFEEYNAKADPRNNVYQFFQ